MLAMDDHMDEDEAPEMLSVELREELGLGADDVLPGTRVKKVKAAPEEDPEVVALAKKMSKRQRKKMDAIEKKKETAEKAARYMKELGKYTLTAEQAALMSSSRNMGHTNTLKEELSRIMKRQQAGLDITEEEERLLYPERKPLDSMVSLLDERMNAPPPAPVPNRVFSNPTRPDPEEPSSSSTGIGLGSMLMQQFNSISASNAVKPSTAASSSSKGSAATEKKLSLASLTQGSVFQETVGDDDSRPKYRPVAMAEPVSAAGVIRASAFDGPSIVSAARNTKHLHVPRQTDVQVNRMQLPVCALEQEIVETINTNDVVIICGETGSGKSTQVPQFLYEAGYPAHGLIGVTQPRRVAASSTAARVAFEMNAPMPGKEEEKKVKGPNLAGAVSYQVRYDTSTVSSKTAIKFMTDGVLLREATEDILLRKYSAILLDEAHERNVNTDVLLGLISRAIPLRKRQAAQEAALWAGLSEQDRERYVPPLQPLKLVIMSATLRVDDFKVPHLFPTPPTLIRVDARQFEVTNHFARRTELRDYLKETHKKVCQIHRKLPPGGILVFLTGKSEIVSMCKRLNKSLGGKGKKGRKSLDKVLGEGDDTDADEGADMDGIGDLDRMEDAGDEQVVGDVFSDGEDGGESDDGAGSDDDDGDDSMWEKDEVDGVESDKDEESGEAVAPEGGYVATETEPVDVVTKDAKESSSVLRDRMLREALGMTVVIQPAPKPEAPTSADGASTAAELAALNGDDTPGPEKVIILPLYAMLDAKAQACVFKSVPPTHRLIVVATNVAETSITIPGMRYVVDCGRCKEKVVDRTTGISRFELRWITKAAAEQRRGRAGRTGPGHCYRLYSSAFFEQYMNLFAEPEITTIPLENLLLQMRSMGVAEVENFPFPTPPPRASVRRALHSLLQLGAMKGHVGDDTYAGLTKVTHKVSVTPLGTAMSKYPINVRLAKMLVKAASDPDILRHVCTVAAALAENSPFLSRRAPVQADDSSDDDDCGGDGGKSKDQDKGKGKGKGTGKGKDKDKRFTGDARWAPMDVDPTLNNVKLCFHPTSDALARQRALGAYGYAVGKQEDAENATAAEAAEKQKHMLCTDQFLHEPTMHRMLRLRKQMLQLCTSTNHIKDVVMDEDSGAAWAPPSAEEETAVKRLMLSGHCDSVARRIPVGTIQKGTRRERLCAYQSCDPSITEPLYIHPESTLYQHDPSASLPDYVCYLTLQRNQRDNMTFMTCVSEVDPSWLPEAGGDGSLLHWGPPLTSPAPFYEQSLDAVLCYTIPTYGAQKWGLPAMKRMLKTAVAAAAASAEIEGANAATAVASAGDVTYRWFARLMLEGTVMPELKLVCGKNNLRDNASALTQKLHSQRALALVTRLAHSRVDSRTSLLRNLHSHKGSAGGLFLSAELEALLQPEARKAFRAVWARLATQAAASAKACGNKAAGGSASKKAKKRKANA